MMAPTPRFISTADSSGYFKSPLSFLPPSTPSPSAPLASTSFKRVNVVVLDVGQTTEVLPHLGTAGANATVEVTGESAHPQRRMLTT